MSSRLIKFYGHSKSYAIIVNYSYEWNCILQPKDKQIEKYLLGGSRSDLAVTGLDPDLIGENVCVEFALLRVGLMLRLFLSTTLASNDT